MAVRRWAGDVFDDVDLSLSLEDPDEDDPRAALIMGQDRRRMRDAIRDLMRLRPDRGGIYSASMPPGQPEEAFFDA